LAVAGLSHLLLSLQLTIEKYIAAQKKKLTDRKIFYKPFQASVRNIIALQATRIFVEGKKSDGTNIGRYNTTTPLYINPSTSPGNTSALKPTTGKTGRHIFKSTGEAHKTTFVKSYHEYRKKIGRKVDKINLDLSGDLKRDFSNGKTPSSAKPVKISDIEYHVTIKRQNNVDKKDGLEDRYGDIFKLTSKEKREYFKTLNFNFKKALIDGQ
jgi:hypothetical protein